MEIGRNSKHLRGISRRKNYYVITTEIPKYTAHALAQANITTYHTVYIHQLLNYHKMHKTT